MKEHNSKSNGQADSPSVDNKRTKQKFMTVLIHIYGVIQRQAQHKRFPHSFFHNEMNVEPNSYRDGFVVLVLLDVFLLRFFSY